MMSKNVGSKSSGYYDRSEVQAGSREIYLLLTQVSPSVLTCSGIVGFAPYFTFNYLIPVRTTG
jgi:hypothetical protein